MSYKWPNKDPQETLDYTIDWSRLMPSGDTLVSANWFIDDASKVKTAVTGGSTVNSLTVSALSASGAKTTILLSAGLANVEYKITCQVTFSGGNVVERSVRLSVKDI
jgi:hypothetical protein